MILPDEVLTCIAKLEDNGYECYVVGGAVRNFLLGLPIHDYDLTTNALPEQMHQVFQDEKVIDTGLKHGTITVIRHSIPIEITTYRKETTYSDHRHPDTIQFTNTLIEDLKRRDFTINAFAYHPKHGVLDYFDGLKDLKNKEIQAIGLPEKRFEEDALRILRALRFSSELGFTIAKSTQQAIHQQKELLKFISMERIQAEWIRILEGAYFEPVLLAYKDVFEIFLPELKQYDHKTWMTRIKQLVSSPSIFSIRFAYLLAPLTLPSGFFKHLKFSNQQEKEIKQLLSTGTLPIQSRIDLRYICQQIQIPLSTFVAYRNLIDSSIDENQLLSFLQQVQSEDCYSLEQLALHGTDLQALGYQGEEIGKTLKKLLDAVIQEQCENKKEALIAYLRTS